METTWTRRVAWYSPVTVTTQVIVPTPDSLEAAIKVFLQANPSFSNQFTGGIWSERKPQGSPVPYLIIEIHGSPTIFTSNTSTVQMTRISMKSFSNNKAEAKTLGESVYNLFKSPQFNYATTRTAPFVIADRFSSEEHGLIAGGKPAFVDTVEWNAREQKPRY